MKTGFPWFEFCFISAISTGVVTSVPKLTEVEPSLPDSANSIAKAPMLLEEPASFTPELAELPLNKPTKSPIPDGNLIPVSLRELATVKTKKPAALPAPANFQISQHVSTLNRYSPERVHVASESHTEDLHAEPVLAKPNYPTVVDEFGVEWQIIDSRPCDPSECWINCTD